MRRWEVSTRGWWGEGDGARAGVGRWEVPERGQRGRGQLKKTASHPPCEGEEREGSEAGWAGREGRQHTHPHTPGVPSTQSRMWSQAEEAADRAELRPRACSASTGGQGARGVGAWGVRGSGGGDHQAGAAFSPHSRGLPAVACRADASAKAGRAAPETLLSLTSPRRPAKPQAQQNHNPALAGSYNAKLKRQLHKCNN